MSFALNERCTSRAPNWRRWSAIVSAFTLVSLPLATTGFYRTIRQITAGYWDTE